MIADQYEIQWLTQAASQSSSHQLIHKHSDMWSSNHLVRGKSCVATNLIDNIVTLVQVTNELTDKVESSDETSLGSKSIIGQSSDRTKSLDTGSLRVTNADGGARLRFSGNRDRNLGAIKDGACSSDLQ
ncbi:hypothetical protein FOPG_03608 [Fusarium oxysporum f. sp. conglutinans race 2 54008]|uniref:Uncharacterized protein n=2 Tax=Fusarium oxysporum TaxID=5507 RepID=A0A2H3TEV9_FUSOX|nr:hypothetical protein FOPG_03608 [Fusarium oxysporum f. sp. conglutinans race 2 54008]SCO87228.1 uncharacterized protein FRV6_11355 [Fusarium oxysporum]